MTSTTANEADIFWVRHELDTLSSARVLGELSGWELLRYKELCALECSLLGMTE